MVLRAVVGDHRFREISEEYLHDPINMTKWILTKFGEHDQKIDNNEH